MGKDAKNLVAVLGGGFAGALTTRALLKDGRRVVLKDMNKTILGKKSSSQNECFKLHTGMHYIGDLKTAEKCLLDSIGFARAFPDCILGYKDDKSPWRRGRHYLVSESLFDLEEARKVAAHLRKVYADKVLEDPRNQVFGPPASFIVELDDPASYPEIASEIPFSKNGVPGKMRVVRAFETGESQIDVDALRAKLEAEFEPYILRGQLVTHFSSTVTSIDHDEESLGFIVHSIDETGQVMKPLEAEVVVNCTWQNIEQIEKNLHVTRKELDETLIRLKTSLLVTLPSSLRGINTCIFSVGPFCSITNLGNGTAVLTYEPVTNIGSFKVGESPEEKLIDIMHEQLSSDKGYGQIFAKEIVEGCAQFLSPEKQQDLLSCEVLEVRLGYVRMHKHANEVYSIVDAKSPIHRRQEHGIEQAGLGYIRFASMKMTYAEKSANEIAVIIRRHLEVKNQMEAPYLATNFATEDDAKHAIKTIRNVADQLIILYDASTATQFLSKVAQFWAILTQQSTASPILTAQNGFVPKPTGNNLLIPPTSSNANATGNKSGYKRPSNTPSKGYGCAIL